MPETEVFVYRDENGNVPLVEWLTELQITNKAAFHKCLALIDLLREFGFELRRPRADLLRDGVYELRTQVRNVHYRLLYGFVGKDVALLSHGLTKKSKVPAREIDLAAERLERFEQDPKLHAAEWGNFDG